MITPGKVMRTWVRNPKADWLYLLARVPVSELDALGVDIAYQWPYPYEGVWEYSDMAGIDQNQETWYKYGWDETSWYHDIDDGGEQNLEGWASQDEEFSWFEFRKPLNSGDPYDWSWEPGTVVGSDLTGDLHVGVYGSDATQFYIHDFPLELGAP